MPDMKKLLIVTSFIVVSFVSLMIGSYYSSSHLSDEFERAQASLSFGQLTTLRKIKSDFSNKCEQQVLERLTHAIDEEKMLIAEYIQSTDDEKLQEYISLRDPELLESLVSYRIDWDKKWTIAGCDKLRIEEIE